MRSDGGRGSHLMMMMLMKVMLLTLEVMLVESVENWRRRARSQRGRGSVGVTGWGVEMVVSGNRKALCSSGVLVQSLSKLMLV